MAVPPPQPPPNMRQDRPVKLSQNFPFMMTLPAMFIPHDAQPILDIPIGEDTQWVRDYYAARVELDKLAPGWRD